MKRLVLILLLTAPVFAQRSLYWESMAVRARLDNAGSLHVTEELAHVFDGGWNGGERTIRLGKGQSFTFGNLSRRDGPTGELKPLSYGSLDDVDGFTTAGDSSVRWRSRLPSDPPFRDAHITYVLEYTLSNVLTERGGRYILDHDFAFPERPGEIRHLTVDLELDPVWQTDLPRHYEAGPLPPGTEFVVKGKLDFRGSGPLPEARHDPLYERIGLAIALLAVPFLLWWLLLRREEKLGRFATLNPDQITPHWIEQNLIAIPAEVVGAAWDEDVDAHEVSALLARWVAEGKVRSTAASAGQMSLELSVPRERFDGYERELIDKLFFAGDETSTTAIRAHYASSGFDPSKIISRGVRTRTRGLAQLDEKSIRLGSLITAPALVAAVYFLYRTRRENGDLHTGIVITLVAMALLSFLATMAAMLWRGRIDHGPVEMKVFRAVIVLVIAGALVMVAGNFVSLDAQVGVAAFALMAASLIIDAAKSKGGRNAIAFRKRLASARQYFTNELGKSDPAIDDRWFPYVIAFGLDSEASSWATRFGGRSTAPSESRSSMSTSSDSSSSSGTPAWSGGGGSFGGAGATGSWAAAAGGLAAGVAAPSSSSSGSGSSGSSSGGGGGGSSSSGGGSGGGW